MSTDKTHIHDMQKRAEAEPFLRGFGLVQAIIVGFVALGHISTLPVGPGNPEALHAFGYDPSWIGVNVLFIVAGFMAMRSLGRNPAGLSVLLSRVKGIFPYLAIYALLIALIVYPILGQPASSTADMLKHLGLYTIDVLACIDPGRALPGLLDDANYQCIIQGAIWTFRWGIAAYVGITIASKLRLLDNRWTVLGIAVTTVSAYAITHSAQVWGWFAFPDNLQPATRLGAMFTVGMAIFTYRAEIFKAVWLAPVIAFATLVQFYAMPWTPLIEIFVSVFWALIAFALMRNPFIARINPIKKQGFAAALYIFHWPIAQLLLLSFPALSSLALIGIALPVAIMFSACISVIVAKGIPSGMKLASKPSSETVA